MNGRVIEANGNEPQIHAEPTVKDVIDGTDSVLDRAVQAVREPKPRHGPGIASKAAAKSSAGPVCDDAKGICDLPSGQSQSRLPSPPSKTVKTPGTNEIKPLEFTLMDAYGREVHASDYLGVPMLITSGACWCGGCQGDAEQLRLLEEKYRATRIAVDPHRVVRQQSACLGIPEALPAARTCSCSTRPGNSIIATTATGGRSSCWPTGRERSYSEKIESTTMRS